MSRKTKIWLITAASLMLIGCMIFGGVMTVLKWDFKRLSTVKYQTNSYKISEKYNNISIISNTADIEFLLCENSETLVECFEAKNEKHSVSVDGDTLVIELEDTRKWYEYIGINGGTSKITLSVPYEKLGELSVKSGTGDVLIPKDFEFGSIDIAQSTGHVTNLASATESIKIKTGTGGINVENIRADGLHLSVSTGKITASSVKCEGDINIEVSTGKAKLSDVICKNLTSSGSTGDLTLDSVVLSEKLSLKRTTGDIDLINCDANEIFIKNNTGDVKGSLLSEKVFITRTDTGFINVPKTVKGGKCEITTDTGDIKIAIN